jgi:ATP-dependent DNA helicase PIF1
VLIREIIRWAVRARRIISVTASTGMAAVNIKGTTLHSWAGCGLFKKPPGHYVKRILKGDNGAERWMRTQILLIDESWC